MYRTAIAFVALAGATGAFGQSTSTTMDMGGGMTHVDAMGPNGAMSSSNCMNMGGGMTTCQTMDMSQPNRSYPTPDMSRPQRTYARPEVSGPEPVSPPIPYIGRSLPSAAELPETRPTGRTLVAPSASPAVPLGSVPVVPTPMSLLSATPIPDWARSGSGQGASSGGDKNDTEYKVSYLGHAFTLDGPKGLLVADLRAGFEQAWSDNPWVEYASSGSGSVYSYNIKSEKVYSDRVEVWVMADHSKNRTTKARTSKLLYEIKCESQTIRELQSAEYDAGGKVLSSFDAPDTPIRVIPETVGSALYDEMCKIKS